MMRVEETSMMKLARAIGPMLLSVMLWLIIFWIGAALAQPTVTRGGALKKRQYQTYSAMTLYVDPTGSDSNACTSSGTGACLTINGALAKLPRFIRHTVTVNIAPGTYAGFTVANFQFDTSGSLSLVGSMVNSTLASGSATGTLTSATAGSTSTGPASGTDTTQSWTTSDLHGRFVTFTSGALSGFSYPIDTNTATSFTFANTTSPGAVAYTIQQPAVVITSAISVNNVMSAIGSASVNISYVNIESTLTASGSSSVLTLTNVSSNGGTPSRLTFYAPGRVFRCAIRVSSGNAISVNAATYYGGSPSVYVRVDASLLEAPDTALVAYEGATNNPGVFIGELWRTIARGSGTYYYNPLVAVAGGSARVTLATSWLYCTNASGVGLGTMYTPANLGGSHNILLARATDFRVENCGTGLYVQSMQEWNLTSTTYFVNTTTAISIVKGGRVNLVGTPPTTSGVTTDVLLDGEAFPFTTITSLPTPQVISNSYGSTIAR